jgi:tRNA threonylcarbamoyladenosine biosynthesis protein TsaE
LPDLVTNSPAETEHAGMLVGERLRTGDVVLLIGELGAGKTTFVRGVAQGTGS